MAHAQVQALGLLRLVTAGSVDDGKSTLIGRLLFDSNSLYEDHVASMRKGPATGQQGLDFSLLTDGLRAEREQGITIDVAYRYVTTARRRFIIADAPGHEQYTRNMATAASTADLAVVLIDASQGVVTQSKRHAFICALLGVPRLVVAVNKMDLIGYSEDRFRAIEFEYGSFVARLGLANLAFIPVSALHGDNVVKGSERMPWYLGPALFPYLEEVYVGGDRNLVDFRFPVQNTIRGEGQRRGYAGRVASGVVRAGDEVVALPSGVVTRVTAIAAFDRELQYAFAGQSVMLHLETELDLGRGALLAHAHNVPRRRQEVEAMVVWTGSEPLLAGQSYWVKHATQWVKARCENIQYRIDPNTLHREQAANLALNEIGRVRFRLFQPIFADDYRRNRALGAFVIVLPDTNDTVGAATIVDRVDYDTETSAEQQPSAVTLVEPGVGHVAGEDRVRLLGQRPATVWLTGLSGAGKTTIAHALERALMDLGRACYVLDGDSLRHGLSRDLGFSPSDRAENIRRVAEVARLFNDAGLIVITAFISPYRRDREAAKAIIGEERIREVYVSTPLGVCEGRDPKGLYRKARAGEIPTFTGISAPYEAPKSPTLTVDTQSMSVEDCVATLLNALREFISPPD